MSKSWESLRKRLLALKQTRGAVSEFCRKSGFSRTAVEKWLDNISSPNIEHLDVIADTLGYKPWDAIKPENEPLVRSHTIDDCLKAVNSAAKGEKPQLTVTASEKDSSPLPPEFLQKLRNLDEKKSKTLIGMWTGQLDAVLKSSQSSSKKNTG